MSEKQLNEYLHNVANEMQLAVQAMDANDTVKAYEHFTEAYRLFGTRHFDVSKTFQNMNAAKQLAPTF